MPRYSEWVQDPDLHKTGGTVLHSEDDGSLIQTVGIYEIGETFPSGEVPPPWSSGDFIAVQANAMAGAEVDIESMLDAGSPNNPYVCSWDYNTGIFGFEGGRNLRAKALFRPAALSPQSGGMLRFVPHHDAIAMPDNAIGWQWEDGAEGYRDGSGVQARPGTVTAAVHEFTVHVTDTYDSTGSIPFVPEVIRASASAVFKSDDPAFDPLAESDDAVSWDGPSDTDVVLHTSNYSGGTFSVDVLPVMDALYRVLIYKTAHNIPVPTDGSMDNGDISYGQNINDREAQWTIRPPLFRWILAPSVAPPCRRYPRTDALSNSARRYPPPKSRQYGNRATGYL